MENIIHCPICGDPTEALDVVDSNKSCEEARGIFFKLSGTPVYYNLCGACGFCFCPELCDWTLRDFEEKIYNNDYPLVDPDYLDSRPRSNANYLISTFPNAGGGIHHLDYGGGEGLLSRLLRESGWQSRSYDPFVDREISVSQLGKFDLITAFEVFEHVPNISELMSNLMALLRPDGIVLFSTLLSDGHIAPNQRLTWWYASPRNGHISLFSRKSLAVLSEKAGLNFGSFSEGFHVFGREIPAWAKHLFS